ncbi:MAG: stage II sporulation protein R [Clostridia bacterium]|nr:stage II sporulation protein R [Clostridia bacterium]
MKKIFFAFMTALELILNGIVYSDSVTEDLSDNLLRLHIIANSDSEYDQNIKLMVRDRIINNIREKSFADKFDVVNNIEETKEDICGYMKKINAGYDCNIYCVTDEFPTKSYNNISMPAGRYECIKVVLGEGMGQNWWCVAYPPLCFTEEVCGSMSQKGREALKHNLDDEAFQIIDNEKNEYKIKFFAVETINKLVSKISK